LRRDYESKSPEKIVLKENAYKSGQSDNSSLDTERKTKMLKENNISVNQISFSCQFGNIENNCEEYLKSIQSKQNEYEIFKSSF
jgi:hypothetical protein